MVQLLRPAPQEAKAGGWQVQGLVGKRVNLYPGKSLFVKVIEDRLSSQLNYCKDILSFVA